MKVPRRLIENYVRTSYRVVGVHKHSSIKPCYWLEQKLQTGRENRNCYKGYWGINSEQCIQNTPSFPFCTHNCVFCWRDTSCSLGAEFKVTPDEPEFLVDELIRHQINLIHHQYPLEKSLQTYSTCLEILEFYKRENVNAQITEKKIIHHLSPLSKGVINKAILLLKNCDVLKTDDLSLYYLSKQARNFLEENYSVEFLLNQMVTNEADIKQSFERALHPNHAAISLDGEPTLYPYIGEFISTFRKKDFTTFIVTNGTTPEILAHLHDTNCLPSILYITLPPPNKEAYIKIHRPKVKDTWEKIHETLKMIKDLHTRTVLRITAVNQLNIKEEFIEGYIASIRNTSPDFLDIKGFTLEGASMSISDRLDSNRPGSYYIPDYAELEHFASLISERSGFPIVATHEKSRDILLSVNWDSTRSLTLQNNEK